MNQKYAILADIHGNTGALDAVLDDIQMRGIENLINLGDIFYGPLDPKGTAERLKDYSIATVQGNQDRELYENFGKDANNPILNFVLNQLIEEDINWLKNLPKTKIVANEIFLCHGTPENDESYLLENIAAGATKLKSNSEIEILLHDIKQPVVLCGHSHRPRSVYLANGQFVLNAGSVGLPAYVDELPQFHKSETGSPHATYTILTRTNLGWNVEHVKIAYDWECAAQEAEKNARNDWAQWLMTGRA